MNTKGEFEPGSLRWSIAKALRECGPLSLFELAEETGKKPNHLSSVLSRMRKARQIHISRYVSEVLGSIRQLRAAYCLGAGRDAPKPDPLSNAERHRRSKARGTFTQSVSSVFELGLTRKELRERRSQP